jgi:hypothetical protein
VLNVCAALLALVVSSVGIILSRTFGIGEEVGGTFLIFLTLIAMCSVVQAVQLPLLFKYGYAKAKFFGLIPFIIIIALYSLIMALSSQEDFLGTLVVLAEFMANNVALVSIATGLAVCLIIYISYRLALSFYRRREF